MGNITPTKIGHFVSLWKKDTIKNKNIPYDINDKYDIYIFLVLDKKKEGFFIFPKDILLQNNILSDKQNNKKGKLGFRLYCSWYNVKELNKTALSSYKWQNEYFYD
jgi:hypothetical protein